MRQFIFNLVLAFAIVWLQIFAMSACIMDKQIAYHAITGHEVVNRMPAGGR